MTFAAKHAGKVDPAQAARVIELVLRDPQALDYLRIARTLGLPDWWLAAGFVRNRVWDALTETSGWDMADIDMLFFDPTDISKQREKALEARVMALTPGVEWEVRNQARMHLHNGDRPYTGIEDAMGFWLETCTAVGLHLEQDDSISIIAPFGLDDLLGLVLRPSAAGLRRIDSYRARLAAKSWRRRWPQATFIE